MNLPDLFPFHGNWPAYEDEIYLVFIETVVKADLKFRGFTIRVQYAPPTNGKGFRFWHLIAEGDREEDRTPDLRRCERISWISWLITNAETHSKICWWENERYNNTHVVIWHEEENFAVVLAKRNGYYVLKTAYLVRSKRAKDFERERDEFWKAQKG